jgi:hypothetical protein
MVVVELLAQTLQDFHLEHQEHLVKPEHLVRVVQTLRVLHLEHQERLVQMEVLEHLQPV